MNTVRLYIGEYTVGSRDYVKMRSHVSNDWMENYFHLFPFSQHHVISIIKMKLFFSHDFYKTFRLKKACLTY